MEPTVCPETSVRTYHSTLRNIPEERRSHLRRGGSLKSRSENCFRCRKVLFNTWSLNPRDCETFPLMAGSHYAQVSFRTGFTLFQSHDLHVKRWYLLWNPPVYLQTNTNITEIRPIPKLNLKNGSSNLELIHKLYIKTAILLFHGRSDTLRKKYYVKYKGTFIKILVK
jgi:hypothetical protein